MQVIDCKNTKFFDRHELVVSQDLGDGFEAIIAIHNSKLGPAQGGTRIRDYQSKQEAIDDVLRLSIGMSYKNCAAGLPAGGGKAVIIKKDGQMPQERHLIKYAEFINELDGKYITTEDVGMHQGLLKIIQEHTKYAVGSKFQTYIYTADLLVSSLEAIASHKYNKEVKDFSYTVQGVGKVGARIVEKLVAAGCQKINICDVNQEQLDKVAAISPNVHIVSNDILEHDTDILIPSAVGGIIHKDNIDQLKYKLICGPANNILLHPEEDAPLLAEKGILYLPDYLVNSGGIVAAYVEWEGFEEDKIYEIIGKIPTKMNKLVDAASDGNVLKLLDIDCNGILYG